VAAAAMIGPGVPDLEIDLEASREAPRVARSAVAGFSETLALEPVTLATLLLLVSELVTNSVVHPDTPSKIRLRARVRADRIRVEVTDAGSGFTPRPRDRSRLDGGYGLHLVASQAGDWGVTREGGTTVWFELAIA
jgi:anti-sigma regulatory factor (Ser/Thr protein kinase)